MGFVVLAIAAIVGALVYIKSQKTATVLPPILNTETGQMVLVPGGPFQQGNEKKQTVVPAFYIDKTEVSNSTYEKFCAATNRPLPPKFPKDRPDEPVVNVTIADARAYAKWADKRLPTAARMGESSAWHGGKNLALGRRE